MLFICLLIVSSHQVKEINDNIFSDSKCKISITIPKSAELIEENEFKNCKMLESVNFSNESLVKCIGKCGFYNCIKLESIAIPNSVKSIGEYAFHHCEKLKSVIFLNEPLVEYFGKWVFSDCFCLESFTIPKSLRKIEEKAFQHCEKLKSVIFSN